MRAVNFKSEAETEGVSTSFVIGAFGNVMSATAAGVTTSYAYDVLGRPRTTTDPHTGPSVMTFDTWGNQRTLKDAEGRITQTVFDNLGRVTKEISPLGTSTFSYDLAPNGIGRLSATKSAEGLGSVETSYSYDEAGKVVQEADIIAGRRYQVDLTYARGDGSWQAGNLKRISYPAVPGRTERVAVDMVYSDSTGALTAVVDHANGGDYWRATSWDPDGRALGETYGEALTRSFGYDPMSGGLSSAETFFQGATVHTFGVSYDSRGNVTGRSSTTPGGGSARIQETFSYDVLSRLRLWRSDTGNYQSDYGYDDQGNLTSKVESQFGTVTKSSSFSFGERGFGPHQLTTAPWGAFTYDKSGDRKTDGTRTLSYAPFHLPVTIVAGARTTTFGYDAQHGRAFKSSPDAFVAYVGGLYEYRRDGNGAHHVFNVSSPSGVVAQLQVDEGAGSELPPQVVHLFGDHLGSPILQVRNGDIKEERFDPFGNRIDSGDRPSFADPSLPSVHIGFTGHENEDELGLINMRGRIYDPRSASFLSADPIVVSPVLSQSFNSYSYVLNNPLSLIDPSGWATSGNQMNQPEFVAEENLPPPASAGGTGSRKTAGVSDEAHNGPVTTITFENGSTVVGYVHRSPRLDSKEWRVDAFNAPGDPTWRNGAGEICIGEYCSTKSSTGGGLYKVVPGGGAVGGKLMAEGINPDLTAAKWAMAGASIVLDLVAGPEDAAGILLEKGIAKAVAAG